jgi:hypothetical protein
MIKVISRSQRGNIETAQIVIHFDGRSQTRHVWKVGGKWTDMWGASYSLK